MLMVGPLLSCAAASCLSPRPARCYCCYKSHDPQNRPQRAPRHLQTFEDAIKSQGSYDVAVSLSEVVSPYNVNNNPQSRNNTKEI
ncbi:hypothetical protein B0H12DRAFT_1156145 [Mycena haematopus]|nr:hypothetical protein B0H12DRAFT_1156145 [Mycena haematopus]